ncbi:carbohydrate ABC transporter permease [Curtobacterium sp. MCBA15_001]|uniref:carbohydrate ABC transporter permease n=1 Tax=Curtobacterium sp. MCBA15_001 TaxID=1898731 RepID=UPI0008DC8D10|nr:carbohydrate ABC transporter permease [Curtobacterium sp. MCBA15_001]OIH96508.1 ABC transporter permease [Curtobacterium sp. MCBA15_001]
MTKTSRRVLAAVLVVVSLIWLVPSYLLVVNAFTKGADYSGTPAWWPTSWSLFDNIRIAFTNANVGQGMANSLLYSVVGAGAAVFIAALASFAVTIMPVKRPTFWFWVIYIGTILPLQAFLSPLFTGFAATSLFDTQYGMLLVYVALTIPFAFFVVRGHMTGLPNEVREAASLDGAGWVRMFFQVHLPLSTSALLAAFVFQFTWIWNDLLFGLTLSSSPNIRPVMATLADLTGNYSTYGPPVALAGALVASLPTVIVFFAFQRFFARGLNPTA